MIERGVCCACAYELMKPINNEGTAVSSYGVPKVKSKGCLSCRRDPQRPPHLGCRWGPLRPPRQIRRAQTAFWANQSTWLSLFYSSPIMCLEQSPEDSLMQQREQNHKQHLSYFLKGAVINPLRG